MSRSPQSFEKRQRERRKQQKRREKQERRLERNAEKREAKERGESAFGIVVEPERFDVPVPGAREDKPNRDRSAEDGDRTR